MAIGKKTGGRTKGTPNRKTQEIVEKAEASGLMPLDFMLSVLRDERQTFDNRMWAAEKAAPYVHAKLASVEHSGPDGEPLGPTIIQLVPAEGS